MVLRNIIIITAVSLLASGAFAIFFSHPVSSADTVQYDRLGYNLSMGNGFSLEESSPFTPTMFREPMYPIFIALIYRLFGHCVGYVIAIQMLLHAVTVLVIYAIAKEVFSVKVAFLSALLVAIFPTLANFTAYVMSETFFTFLLSLSIYIFLRAIKSGGLWRFALSGLLLGMLALTKLTSLFLPAILVVTALCVKKTINIKKFVFGAICLLVVFSIVVSGWSLRNKRVFNTYSLSLRGSDVMWSRAQKIDDSPREILATACCSFSEYLGKRLFPDIVIRSDRYLYKDLDRVVELQERYMKEGMRSHEADERIKKEALNKISQHPFKYLSYTFIEMIKMSAFTHLPYLNEPSVRAYFHGIRNGDLMLSLARGVMRMAAYPILLLFVIGMARNLQSWNKWLIIFVVILYFNVVYSLIDTIGRYGVPLIPFYCVFAISAFYPSRSEAV